MAHTAAQVADLSNQHPRYGRHTVSFKTPMMLRCCVAVFFAIDYRFTRTIWNTNRLRRGSIQDTTRRSRQHSLWASTARAVAIDVISQWAGPRVLFRHTFTTHYAAVAPLLVLKMSRADTTNPNCQPRLFSHILSDMGIRLVTDRRRRPTV